MVELLIVMIVAGIGVAIVGFVLQSRWPKACPTCQAPIPRFVRKPADSHEAMWGGWTCRNCGTRPDRQGEIRTD